MIFSVPGTSDTLLDNARIKSILLTASDESAAFLNVFEGQNTTVPPKIVVKALTNETTQVYFDGFPFPSGFTVTLEQTPDCNVIEYVRGSEYAT